MSTQIATPRRSTLTAWLPVVLWAAVIFAFSSVPSLGTGLGAWDVVLRKLTHVSEYAILGFLLARAVRRPAVAVVLAAGYAFVEGRHGAPLDVAIDTAGALVGVLVWLRWSRRG